MADATQKIIFGAQPGNQTLFLNSTSTEVLYAGQAGGGKSFALTLAALRYYRESDYHAIIFRRNYPDLEDLIHKAIDIYAPMGFKFNEQKHLFTHQEFGSRIKFSHLSRTKDIYDHQGQEYDFIGFDELCQFPKMPYVYLMSRLRGKNKLIKRYIRSTGNPDGEGLLWVKARFIDCMEPLKPRWFTTQNDRDVEVPAGTSGAIRRLFVPCVRAENKILMESDPEYEAMLNQLPEDKKRALKYGIWDSYDRPFQIISTNSLQMAISGAVTNTLGVPVIGADYAESGDMCSMCVGIGNRVVRFREWPGMDTGAFVEKILQEADKLAGIYGFEAVRIGVDAIGPGTGVYHALRRTRYAANVDPMRYKDPKFDAGFKDYTIKMKFNNLRSQMWWKAGQDFKKEKIDLSQLLKEKGYYDNFHMLQEELLSHTYREHNGQIIIIDKNTLRKPDYLNRSPDRADSLVIWNFIREKNLIPALEGHPDLHFNPEFNQFKRKVSAGGGDFGFGDDNPEGWQAL